MEHGDSEWSLVSAVSDNESPVPPAEQESHTAPELASEAKEQEGAELASQTLDSTEGTGAAGSGVEGLISSPTTVTGEPEAVKASAGGRGFSLMPSTTEVTALSGGAEKVGEAAAEEIPYWQIPRQTISGESGPERVKIPLQQKDEAEYRLLVGDLAHIVQMSV